MATNSFIVDGQWQSLSPVDNPSKESIEGELEWWFKWIDYATVTRKAWQASYNTMVAHCILNPTAIGQLELNNFYLQMVELDQKAEHANSRLADLCEAWKRINAKQTS